MNVDLLFITKGAIIITVVIYCVHHVKGGVENFDLHCQQWREEFVSKLQARLDAGADEGDELGLVFVTASPILFMFLATTKTKS